MKKLIWRHDLLLILGLVLWGSCSSPLPESGPDNPAATEWRMVVMGDSRDGLDILMQLVDIGINLHPRPDVAVHLGDFIGNPSQEANWPLVQNALAPLMDRMSFYPAIGNHDVNSDASEARFKNEMPLPGNQTWYRVDLTGTHLLFLDGAVPGEEEEIAGEQLAWLQTQLDELSSSPDFKLIFCHFPFLPAGSGAHTPLHNSEQLRDMFQTAGVQAVFSAHNHFYAHQIDHDIDYFTTGGAGAPLASNPDSFYHLLLVSIGPERLVVQALGLDHRVAHTVTVPR